MGAPIGNEFWKNRMDMTKDGRKLSIEEVRTKVAEYIERCVNDKIYESDWVGGHAKEVSKPKMITMSIYGACVHLGIDYNTWKEWRKDKKYSHILTRAETVFKSYNIEGASAGLLKESIIARLEGLKDQSEVVEKRIKIKVNGLED
jgi:hypothetical protein